MMPQPHNVHFLTSGTYRCDQIKISKWRIILSHPGQPKIIIQVLTVRDLGSKLGAKAQEETHLCHPISEQLNRTEDRISATCLTDYFLLSRLCSWFYLSEGYLDGRKKKRRTKGRKRGREEGRMGTKKSRWEREKRQIYHLSSVYLFIIYLSIE